VVSEGTTRGLFRGRREVAVPRHGWRRGCEIRGGGGDSQQNRDGRGDPRRLGARTRCAGGGFRSGCCGARTCARQLREGDLAAVSAASGHERASGRAPWHAGAGSCGRAPGHAGAGSCGRALRSLERGLAAAAAASVRAGAGAATGVGCESRACVAGAGAVYTAPLIVSRDINLVKLKKV
jgi:hypothetical protein